MNKSNKIYSELMEAIVEMPVIDCHEHLIPENMRVEGKVDFFNIVLSHYASSDLTSAGMRPEELEILRDYSTDFDEKVRLFIPIWNKTANTGYCYALKIAMNDLYGIDRINEATLPELNRRIIDKNKPGLYKSVLQDKLHIEYCIWDQFYLDNPEKDDFFRLALRLDNVISINDASDIKALEKKFSVNISTPNNIEEIMEICITSYKNRGLTTIKSALAYERTLYFEPVSRTEATLALDKILRGRFTESDVKKLQDYLMYSVAEKVYWHNLPLQIHTGLQEGNGNYIQNAKPGLLSDLIQANPHTRFDLFHGGYPYGGEIAAMAKMYPNVYLDMAWTHVISPEYSRRYLKEWLDAVPVSKILGFGGDYLFVEGVYGHLKIAKENIGFVLAEKVEEGVFTIEEAIQYAKMMLYDNPRQLYDGME